MLKFISGLVKSEYDSRDLLVRSFIKDMELPTQYDITDKMTPVRSQGAEGSCAGFAMAVGVKEYQEQIDCKKLIELSPRYIYEKAKAISGHAKGTTLRAVCQVALKQGVCEEQYYPYIPNDIGSPSPLADKNAEKYKIKGYARITGITELKRAIINFGAVIIGVKIYQGMMSDEARRSGIVPNPSCFDKFKMLGGHALTACGYHDESPYYKNDGHIKIKGSWLPYGKEGFCYLSYKYIERQMIDAFSSVDILGSNKPMRLADLDIVEGLKAWV